MRLLFSDRFRSQSVINCTLTADREVVTGRSSVSVIARLNSAVRFHYESLNGTVFATLLKSVQELFGLKGGKNRLTSVHP